MMTIEKKLLRISELNNAQILAHVRTNKMEGYIKALKLFVENFPTREIELKNTLEAKDSTSFLKCLAAIKDMLIHISADRLSDECQKIINEQIDMNHKKVEVHTTFLLSLLTMLSIDIQMAVYKDENLQQSEDSEEKQPSPKDLDALVQELEALMPERSEPVKSETLRTGSILAVDDNSFFLDTLKNALQNTGYKLTCVNSGKAALKFLETHIPDLFILDVEMPEMDGYELARKIRIHIKKIPILFLTGNATLAYVTKAIKAGASDFIVKPITQNQVLERIGKFI